MREDHILPLDPTPGLHVENDDGGDYDFDAAAAANDHEEEDNFDDEEEDGVDDDEEEDDVDDDEEEDDFNDDDDEDLGVCLWPLIGVPFHTLNSVLINILIAVMLMLMKVLMTVMLTLILMLTMIVMLVTVMLMLMVMISQSLVLLDIPAKHVGTFFLQTVSLMILQTAFSFMMVMTLTMLEYISPLYDMVYE